MVKLRPVLTIPETAAALATSKGSVYELIHKGELETTDVGTGSRSRTRVFADSVAALLARRASKPRRGGRAA